MGFLNHLSCQRRSLSLEFALITLVKPPVMVYLGGTSSDPLQGIEVLTIYSFFASLACTLLLPGYRCSHLSTVIIVDPLSLRL